MENQDLKSANSTPEDYRKSPRKNAYIHCTVKCRTVTAEAYILDISLTGAFIQCAADIYPGMKITLTFNLPSEDTHTEISVPASIIHEGRFIQGYDNFTGFGIRFLSLSPHAELLLKDTLSRSEDQTEKKYVMY